MIIFLPKIHALPTPLCAPSALVRACSITAALCTSALCTPAAAQTTPEEDEAIVVSAARSTLPPSALPLTIDIINKDALETQLGISGALIDAVATLTPSFSPTRQKLSGAGESLRGRAPLFAINNIPQSTPLRDGSRDGFSIDPFFIERVELIFGSNAIQGIGATGGIINQVTVAPPRQNGVEGRFLVQGGSDGALRDQGFGGKIAGLLGFRAGNFSSVAGAAYEERGVFYDGKGRRVGVDDVQGELQDSRSLSLFTRLSYDFGDHTTLDLLASRFRLLGDGDFVPVAGNRALGLPASSRPGEQQGLPPSNKVETLALTLTSSAVAGSTLTAQLFYNRTRETFGGGIFPDFQDRAFPPFGQLFEQSQNRSRKLGSKISVQRALPGLENVNLIAGFDTLIDRTSQALVRTGRDFVAPIDYRSLAPFAQANARLFGDVLSLSGGVRYEDVRLKIDDFTTLAFFGAQQVRGGTPRFDDALLNTGVVLTPLRGVRLYASYAEGYTLPDVGRIIRAINQPGVDIDDFLDISPIISTNSEVGIEVKRGFFEASASYFTSNSSAGQLLVLVNDVFQVQRQRVEIKGFEANISLAPLAGLRLSAGYADLEGRTDTDGDGRVDIDLDGANISPDRLNLAASYQNGPFSARLQTQFFFSRGFLGADPRNAFAGYTLTDLALAYESRVGRFSLSVQNLFDRFYISYNSDTQRPTDNARFFAGRGRSFTLGYSTKF
jgi:iron complex outermembrane recepter protein